MITTIELPRPLLQKLDAHLAALRAARPLKPTWPFAAHKVVMHRLKASERVELDRYVAELDAWKAARNLPRLGKGLSRSAIVAKILLQTDFKEGRPVHCSDGFRGDDRDEGSLITLSLPKNLLKKLDSHARYWRLARKRRRSSGGLPANLPAEAFTEEGRKLLSTGVMDAKGWTPQVYLNNSSRSAVLRCLLHNYLKSPPGASASITATTPPTATPEANPVESSA